MEFEENPDLLDYAAKKMAAEMECHMNALQQAQFQNATGSISSLLGGDFGQYQQAVLNPNYGFGLASQLGMPRASYNSSKNRCTKFFRINEKVELEEGCTYKEPLDELRIKVSRWLGKD